MEEYYYDNILDWHFDEIRPGDEFQRRVWNALDSEEMDIPEPEVDPSDIPRSCERLYLHSLRTKRRLPDELHDMMLLWSYSDEGEMCSRLYLLWADRCDELEESRRKWAKAQRLHDNALLLMMAACGVILFALLVL